MYDVTLYINSAAELAWVMNHYTDDYYYWSDWLGRTLVADAYTSSININADIDMSAGNWIPLGGKNGGNIHYGYNGSDHNVTFNGNGHTIKLKIKDATDNYQGLFAGISKTGTVKNLHVVADIHCAKSRLVGGIAGENDGTIENCKVSGLVRSDWKESSSAYTAKVGGIAGENNGTIKFCCVTANVENNDADVGGIVGDNSGHTIQPLHLLRHTNQQPLAG